mmetsp:Transcript_68062/g.168163  ORF Transcript_68062/g.168163 Transcript_68062/m.168163 type:complete len:385 (+) Transcript_68062:174-1328(+)
MGSTRGQDIYSSVRSNDSVLSRSIHPTGAGPGMSGVGIFFQQEPDGKVYVKTIVSGGSAERDGRVRVGDVICGVDGRDVIGEPVSVLRSLLLGHEGSFVVLTFARAVEAGVDAETELVGNTVIAKFDVELMRGSPEYLARLDASRRYESELVDLRQQLKQALAEEKEIAEEVERVKRVLQLERGASARREKEMEEIRTAHQREVTALQEACRRAEQVKRDAVGRLMPVQSRETDMTEELSRMKEKDRLRKEYVDELRKRHEEEAGRLEVQLSKEQRARREEQSVRMEVERELTKARTELKRESEHMRIISDQDRMHRDRTEMARRKFKELVEAMETVYSMGKEVEESAIALQNDFLGARVGVARDIGADLGEREGAPDKNFFIA